MDTTFPSSPQFINLIGKKFNRWTVMKYAGKNKRHHLYWFCRCDCGTEAIIYGNNLTRNLSKSCGCLKSEITADRNRRKAKHGSCGTPEYRIWHAILQRCNNLNNRSYEDYGGRGIKCCERWNSFEIFLSDVGPRPSKFHSIDRFPNNNGNYEPGNVRWATHKEQDRNKRTNRMLTYNGETLCVTEWAERLNIPRQTIFSRLRKGMNIEKVLEFKR